MDIQEFKKMQQASLEELSKLKDAGFNIDTIKKFVEDFDPEKFVRDNTIGPEDIDYGALN